MMKIRTTAHHVAAHTAHAAGGSSSGQGVVSASQVRASRAGCTVCSRSMLLTKTGASRHTVLLATTVWALECRCVRKVHCRQFDHPKTAKHLPRCSVFVVRVAVLIRTGPEYPRFEVNSMSGEIPCCHKVSQCVADISEKNNSSSWARLFKFGRRYLAQPRRGGQRRSLMSVVKRQLEDEADPSFQRDSCLPHLHSYDPMQYLAKRVSAKLEECDYRGAVRISCSEDAIADITDETQFSSGKASRSTPRVTHSITTST